MLGKTSCLGAFVRWFRQRSMTQKDEVAATTMMTSRKHNQPNAAARRASQPRRFVCRAGFPGAL